MCVFLTFVGKSMEPDIHVNEDNDLILCSKIGYEYTGSSRAPRKQIQNTNKAPIIRLVKFSLPLLATPNMWIRHKYSLQDIQETLHFLSSGHIWKLASLLGYTTPYFAVQPTHATRTDIKFSDKKNTLNKILTYVQSHYTLSKTSVLERSHSHHNPPLPAHHVPGEHYNHLRSLIPTTSSWSHMKHNEIYFDFYNWRGVQLIPIRLEGNHILCMRVVPLQQVIDAGRDISCMCTKPMTFLKNNQLYAALTDESCFLLPI